MAKLTNWFAQRKALKKEQERLLQQKQQEERIAAFHAPSRPYVLIMFKIHVRLIGVSLERVGLETRIAYTNTEALIFMKIAKPAILICYTGICNSNGVELIKSIHSDPELANIDIVVVAQDATQNQMLPKMKQLGATECFSVPFVPVEFAAIVSKLM